jgi:hypothetical protein
MNQGLRELFEQDQADRQGGMHPGVVDRDRRRRERLAMLVAGGALQDADDFWHAAMLLQHGNSLDDYWRAHELAKQGAALGHSGCRWLAAAAYDRWLVNQGKLQKYGTQARTVNGHLELCAIDPATTDAQRAVWLVKPLAELRPRESSMLRPGASEATPSANG